MSGTAVKRVIFGAAVLTFLGAASGVAFGLAQPTSPVSNNSASGPTPSASASRDGSAENTSTDGNGGQTTQEPGSQGDPSTAPSANGNGSNNGNNGGNTSTTTKVPVPGVTNLSESDAKTQLKNKGLQYTVKYSCDGNSDAGKVSAQSPYANSSVDKNSKVTITVEGVKVLDVIGSYVGGAQDKLGNYGFNVVVQESGSVVTKQSPSGGSCKPKGSTVTLTAGDTTPPSSAPPNAQGSPDPDSSPATGTNG
jgi:hypothetical protein